MDAYGKQCTEILSSLLTLIEKNFPSNLYPKKEDIIEKLFSTDYQDKKKLYGQYLTRLFSQWKKKTEIHYGVPSKFIYSLNERFYLYLSSINDPYKSLDSVFRDYEKVELGLSLINFHNYEDFCKNIYVEDLEGKVFLKRFKENLSAQTESTINSWLLKKSHTIESTKEFEAFKNNFLSTLTYHYLDFTDDKIEKQLAENLQKKFINIANLHAQESLTLASKQKRKIISFLTDIKNAVEAFEADQSTEIENICKDIDKLEAELNNSNLKKVDNLKNKWIEDLGKIKELLKKEEEQTHIYANEILPLPTKQLIELVVKWIETGI
jgi:hypothetical protein